MAPEVFVLDAFLDSATCALESPNLHLEVVQRSPHIAIKGLREHLKQQSGSFFGRCRLVLCHKHVQAQQAFAIASVFQQTRRRPFQEQNQHPVQLRGGPLVSRRQGCVRDRRLHEHIALDHDLFDPHIHGPSTAKQRELELRPAV